MSKNISIQEGGSAVQMTVDKLETNLVGGGSCQWRADDEVQLTTKTINKNGTNKAVDDGYYGYSKVTVKVPGGAGGPPGGVGSSIIGRDRSTGDDIKQTVNADGEIETTLLPVSISVTTLPSKLSYVDGEEIDYTGMVVTAYRGSGAPWTVEHPNGHLVISELTLPTTQASWDVEDVSVFAGGVAFDLYGEPIIVDEDMLGGYRSFDFGETKVYGTMLVKLLGSNLSSNQYWEITLSDGTSFRTIAGAYWKEPWYFRLLYENDKIYVQDMRTNQQGGISNGRKDDYTQYFTIQEVHGGFNTIPVQYVRPDDGKVLETSFEVSVANTASTNET